MKHIFSSKRTVSLLLAALLAFSTLPVAHANGEASPTPSQPLELWYDKAAPDTDAGWENLTLPIGNGHIGGRIFGGISTEKVQFNEKTLWTGGPGTVDNWMGMSNNADNAAHFEEAQNAIFQNDFAKGQNVLSSKILRTEGATYDEFRNEVMTGKGNYQDFGELYLDSGLDESKAAHYRRDLDLETAISSVQFAIDGITYHREYFVSHPDHVMAMKFTASETGKVNLTVRPQVSDPSTKNNTTTVTGDTITLKGTLKANGLQYESQFKVIAQSGTAEPTAAGIQVKNADSVVILMSAGTNYQNNYPVYRGEDPHNSVTQFVTAAAQKGYDAVKAEHIADHSNIFSRVDLDLGQQAPDVPTDAYLSDYKAGSQKYDPKAMEVLLFQYGRYLLIASSREDTLPANLQGVWNKDAAPAWQSDYHFNVNIQMNYWPAYVTNMTECADSLVDYVESIVEPGKVTAKDFFGATNEDAWAILTSNNPMGFTGSTGHLSSWAPTNGAWICQNLWDYYAFTGDMDKLRDQIYPIMRGSVLLYKDFLVEDPRYDGRLVIAPSYSPEHGPVTAGTTYDQELIWQLYTDFIKASEILGVDESLRQEIAAQREKLDSLQINPKNGNIKEWMEEDAHQLPGIEPGHRHNSHLLGLHPGNHITVETPEYMEAAIKSLNSRSQGGTGWSQAQKINLWARAQDGENAYQQLQTLLKGSILNNLSDNCPPFQIDGNFGATSGVAEMLLQSHTEYIQPIPAIPASWDSGSVDGLMARNGFEINISWNNGTLAQMSITSKLGAQCNLLYEDIGHATVLDEKGNEVATENVADDKLSFQTEKGKTYTVVPNPTLSAVKAMNNEIKVSQALEPNDYDKRTWRDFAKALETALAIDADNSYLEEISQATSALQAARKALVPLNTTVTWIDDKDGSIVYTGSWSSYSDAKYYKGSQNSCTPGGTASYTFEGTGIEYVMEKAQSGGIAEVFIDDVSYGEVDTYTSGAGLPQVSVFEKQDLPAGRHTIKIVNTGKKNPAITGVFKVKLDAFKVTVRQADTSLLEELISLAGKQEQNGCPQELWAALQQEISLAQAAAENPNVTDAEIETRQEALQKALDAVIGAQLNKTPLQNAIAEAQKKLDGATIGDGVSEYPQLAADQLNRAIQEAKAVISKEPVTQKELDDAIIALEKAVESFENSVIGIWKALLKDTIDQAETAKANYPPYLIEAVKLKFEAALDAAWAAYENPDATDAELMAADDLLIQMLHYLSFTADPTGLTEAIENAKALIASGKYLEDDSMSVYKSALATAEALLKDPAATITEYEAAIKALADAQAKLTPKPVVSLQLEALQRVVDKASGLDLNAYLDNDAKAAFQNALANAEDILAKAKGGDESVTQKIIDDATIALHGVLSEMRLIPSKEALEELLNDAKTYNLAKYTAESGAKLTAAIETAEKVLRDPLADEYAVAEAENALNDAMRALVPIEDKGASSQKPDDGQNPATGDSAPHAPLALLALLCAGAMVALRKKK